MMNEALTLQTHSDHDFLWNKLIAQKPYRAFVAWDTPSWDFKEFKAPGDLYKFFYTDTSAVVVYTTGKLVVMGSLSRKGVNFNIAGIDVKEIEDHINNLKKSIEVAKEAADGRVICKFWFMSSHGPTFVGREIAVPDWDEISGNYESSTRRGLEHLLKDFKPSHGGQLILWQGDPGTGKTYALRSLVDAWKEWCSVEYIVDPDHFFGGSSSYMMQLISDGNDIYDEWGEDVEERGSDPKKKEWKLFILEDTGELLSLDARERSGQGLARLLNVVDGFIGQGLKVLLLITSNEELQKLHPAVSRPGRCAAIVRFNELKFEDAQQWAKAKGIKLTDRKDYTLAELYALAGDFENKPEANLSSAFGFKMPV